jgi:hypothetical protein
MHPNAPLTPEGRLRLCHRIAGESLQTYLPAGGVAGGDPRRRFVGEHQSRPTAARQGSSCVKYSRGAIYPVRTAIDGARSRADRPYRLPLSPWRSALLAHRAQSLLE